MHANPLFCSITLELVIAFIHESDQHFSLSKNLAFLEGLPYPLHFLLILKKDKKGQTIV